MIEVFELRLNKGYHVVSFGPTVVGGYYLRSSKALLGVLWITRAPMIPTSFGWDLWTTLYLRGCRLGTSVPRNVGRAHHTFGCGFLVVWGFETPTVVKFILQ
jgi:hypothetical protein